MKQANPELDPQTLEKIKNILKERKKVIEKELAKITRQDKYEHEDHQPIFPEYGDKNDENANEIATFSNNLSLTKALESSLRDIEAALDRIKKGTYGICKYCHKPISKERLLIRPVSSACIECKKRIKGEL